MLVGGEAGVGKTRLVGEVVAAARGNRATVLVGGCVELGGEGVPFAPLIEALRGFVRDLDEPGLARLLPGHARSELARLLPELAPVAGPGVPVRSCARSPVGSHRRSGSAGPALSTTPGPWSERGRLFELFLGLLERLGEERPAVLVVEDLHWADRSTRDLLAFLVRNLRHGRLLLLLTYRSDELHRRHPLRPFLAELDRGRRVERLELARFGRAEVAAQLAGIQGAPVPAELAERIHARSGGNAFFVEELAAAAATDGELPPSLRDTLLARIELLAEPAQRVLGVAAASGTRVDHDLLAEVAGLPEPNLLSALRETVSAQVLLVDADDGTYGFRHALVKEAVYGELLPGERTRLHAASPPPWPAGTSPATPARRPSSPGTGMPPTTWTGPCRRRSRPGWRPSGRTPSPRPSASSSGLWSCGTAPAARSAPSGGTGWTRPSCWPGRARRPPTAAPPSGRWPWSARPWPKSTRRPSPCGPPSSPSGWPSTCGSPAGRGRSRPTRRRSGWSRRRRRRPGPRPWPASGRR